MDMNRYLDERYMQTCLDLATKGWGMTLTNPLVGAVIVKDGRIIGTGFHRKLGEAHAETMALVEAGSRARGATLYVNLEPCCCAGRTPPCVHAITTAGIMSVVIAMKDPNPSVNGNGIAFLQEHGVIVRQGILMQAARRMNRAYCTYILKKRPYIIMKIAISKNGRLSGYKNKYITSYHSRRHVHSLRSQVSGVLVGIGTILSDDPFLTDRLVGRHNPARIVLDPDLSIPTQAHILEPTARRIIVTHSTDTEKIRYLEQAGVEIIPYTGELYPLTDLLHDLAGRSLGSLLLEGGVMTFNAFFEQNLYDEVFLFVAEQEVPEGKTLTQGMLDSIVSMQDRKEKIGEDTLYHVYRDH